MKRRNTKDPRSQRECWAGGWGVVLSHLIPVVECKEGTYGSPAPVPPLSLGAEGAQCLHTWCWQRIILELVLFKLVGFTRKPLITTLERMLG